MHDGWVIQGGRMLDPASGRDVTGDLIIERGVIVASPSLPSTAYRTMDARGLVVVPGLIDLHVHFREPGNEDAETIATGSRAAARGGFTTVVTMPNTTPAVDTPEAVSWQISRAAAAGLVDMKPSACITRARAGRELADLAALRRAGAAAFTDDGSTVSDPVVMKSAMQVAAELGVPVMDHALDPALSGQGVMHLGDRSRQAGLPGIPAEAETRIVERDIALARETRCHMHIQHISCGESVRLIRLAQSEGLPVSAEATPHHVALCDEDVDPVNPDFKMSPPLASSADQEAIRNGIADGTLQAFATDHAPHRAADKARGFLKAPFGVVGLETAVGVTYTAMVRRGSMPVMEWLRRWTCGPAAILGLPSPSLSAGQPADITVLDLTGSWTVRPEDFLSKSRNTPFTNWPLTGRAVCTLRRGIVTWQAGRQTEC